ncbi:MAG: ion channel, partial [Pseudolabrys sp.]
PRPKADILALVLFTAAPSDSSKILRGVEDNRRWLRFRNAEANREPHKRDRRLRQKYTDQLLTLLALFIALEMFVFSPLQAMGIFAFQGFLVATLLAILAGMFIISDHPAAFAVMSICLAANVLVFLLRLFYPPWHYNIYILAAAWFAIAITLGVVVAQAVFRRGRITYHRIIGAILLYLLIAVAFGALFVLIGLSAPDAFKGITFEDNPALANSVTYLSFVTLTSTGFGDIVPVHPVARTLCNIESIVGQLYPATLLARLVTLEMRERGSVMSAVGTQRSLR